MRTVLVSPLVAGLLLVACDQGAPDTPTLEASPTAASGTVAPDASPSSATQTHALEQLPEGCAPGKVEAVGDFDGDGERDRINFYPAYADDQGFTGWILRQRYGDGQGMSTEVEARCPRTIGAADIDRDGDQELFFDTGDGMTAALIDVAIYDKGKLRPVSYQPSARSLYVGASNAGTSDVTCSESASGPVIEVMAIEPSKKAGGNAISSTFELRGPTLQKLGGGEYPTRGTGKGLLSCFGLRWKGY